MNNKFKHIFGLLMTVSSLAFWSSARESNVDKFEKTLTFNNYRFQITTSDTGSIRRMVMTVFLNDEQLIVIRQKTDGLVAGADVADLDQNGSPEVYIYCCTYGSGSFGKTLGFQFFPSNFSPISMLGLTPQQSEGYMGHDFFKIQNGFLERKFPVYRPGDSNAQATGGSRTLRYALRLNNERKLVLQVVN